MAVVAKEVIMGRIKTLVGERSDDEALSIIEDVSDTLDAGNDSREWQEKYETNDREWRERYKSRFFDGGDDDGGEDGAAVINNDDGTTVIKTEEDKPLSYDDLFE